jgi:ligand-binding sensor domain-containing protein/two-component sensor histidine kinase
MLRAFQKCYVLFSFLSLFLHGQNLHFNHTRIGTEEGLNSLNIFSVNHFPNGLSCITTENGAYLYNGFQFSLLKHDSLKNPTVLNSSIKNNSEIYLLTREYGVVNYHLQKQTARQITPLSYSNTPDVLIENDSYLYLLTSEIRLDIFDKNNNQITEDAIKLKNKNNQAFCIFKTSKGKILLGRSDGLYELNAKQQIKNTVIKNIPVYSIAEDGNGNLFFGSASRIYKLDSKNNLSDITPVYKTKSSTFSFGGEKNITKILVDKFNRIWFTSYPNENLYVYDQNNTYDVFDAQNISPTLINNVYKDKQENIWVSTFDDGIYIFKNSFFRNTGISYAEKTLNIYKSVFKDSYLFSATSNGLYAIDLNSNALKTISAPDNILTEPIYDIQDINSKLYYSKRSQFNLSESRLTSEKYTLSFKPLLGKLIIPFKSDKLIIADWQANVLLSSKESGKKTDTLISFPDYRTNIFKLFLHNDSLFVATNKGLFLHTFSKKTNTPEVFYANQRVYDISEINGSMVLCMEDGIREFTSGKTISYTGTKTLSGVKKIEQHQNYIWLATNEGLMICDKNLTPLKLYNKSNGLISNIINDITFNNTSICISTPKGISVAGISNLIESNYAPDQISIDYLLIGNKKKYIQAGETILLNADETDVAVYFNSPVYTKPVKQYFKYKLDNGDWIFIENTTINLTGLSGGNHQLTIVASNDNINWSEPVGLSFTKEVKFTETSYSFWILIIIIASILSSVSYFFIRRSKNIALKRIQEEQQVNLLKHQAMNALLSPHFIFNSLTSIQNYINSNNSLKASEYLAKFSRLIRMIIEKASQRDIVLRDEITRLSYYLELEKERFKNKFDYYIHIGENINQDEIRIPNMIIQPHAENCIIHGILPKMEHGQLDISFQKTNTNTLLITIEDNGIGLIKAREHSKTGHKSLGTSTIKSILELNSQLSGKTQKVSMVDKSTLNPAEKGTRIEIELEL